MSELNKTPLLEVRDLKEHFDINVGFLKTRPLKAVDGVSFSINRGDMHGVSAGMAVVNGDGLVGRVYEVGMNYANVITIIDPRSSLACLVQRTRDNGIMEGGVADNADTAEEN